MFSSLVAQMHGPCCARPVERRPLGRWGLRERCSHTISFALGLACLVMAVLAGCGGQEPVSESGDGPYGGGVPQTEDAVPKVEARSKYGNPASYVVRGKRYSTLPSSDGFVQRGIASWYGSKFHGRRTSSGETYDMYAMSAAHKALPLPTYARVTHLGTGASIIVKINDRGPFHDNRVLDLSYAAALRLGIVRPGTGPVEIRAITPGSAPSTVPSTVQGQPEVSSRSTATGPKPGAPTTSSGAANSRATVNLYLQIGAFSNVQNARSLVRRVKDIEGSIGSRIDKSTDREQPVYRVRLGPFLDARELDAAAARLPAYGVNESVVVVEPGVLR
jgi:rare lipoprotein A